MIVYALANNVPITDALLSSLGQPNGLQVADLLNSLEGLLGILGVLFATSLFTHAIGVGAERAVVQSILNALKRGWSLLRTNLMDFISWGLILAMIIIGMELIVALVFGQLLNVPQIDQSTLGAILITLNVVTGVVTTVLIGSLWTLVYREWQLPNSVDGPETKRNKKRALQSGE